VNKFFDFAFPNNAYPDEAIRLFDKMMPDYFVFVSNAAYKFCCAVFSEVRSIDLEDGIGWLKHKSFMTWTDDCFHDY